MLQKQPITMEVKDRGDLAETYANKVVATMFDGSAVVITFGNVRTTPETVGERQSATAPLVHVVSRIAISANAALELHDLLTQTLAAIRPPAQRS